MSAMFDNVITAFQAMRAAGYYPLISSWSRFLDPASFENLDRARGYFYKDPRSLKVFDWVCQYRMVMAFYGINADIELPNMPFTKEKWSSLCARAEAMTDGFAQGDYLLDRIDTWLLESYTLKGRCEVQPGDIVLDCGSHSGNTCLYFSQKTGPEGTVYGFEPCPDIFAMLEKNTSGIPNITIHNCAVSNSTGLFAFEESGAGSRLTPNGGIAVYGMTIDEFVAKHSLESVDFIKMDIEGAEEAALIGAADSIRKYKPRMALSAYHKEMDIVALPTQIAAIVPTYRFALRHYSNNGCETVLYCYHE